MTEATVLAGLAQKLRDLKLRQPSLASSDRSARPVAFDTSAPIYLSADERDTLLRKLTA
jgi:hypothetical protein